ncbi:MAG: small multi-drug export protein [Ruminococcus sp.]|nr:small multi-drug export protein [Ruminococcus sp.]
MESFISMLNDTLHMNGQLFCFLISMFPILELRGGLIAAALCKVPLWQALPLCIAGNFLPIPFLVLFIEKLLKFLRKTKLSPVVKFVDFLEEKANKSAPKIMKHKTFGLTIFVGIPLPVTGAWTGGLVAGLFKFNLKQTFIATILGLCMSSAIMTIITYVIPWIVTTYHIPMSVIITVLVALVVLVVGFFVVKSIIKKKKNKTTD